MDKIKELIKKLLAASDDSEKQSIQADITAAVKDLESSASKSEDLLKDSKKYRQRAQKAESALKKVSEKLDVELPGEDSDADIDDVLDAYLEKTTGKVSESDKTVKKMQKELDQTRKTLQDIQDKSKKDQQMLREKDRNESLAASLTKKGINSKFSRIAVRDLADQSEYDEESGEWKFGGKSLDEAIEGYAKSEPDFFGEPPRGGTGSGQNGGGATGPVKLSEHLLGNKGE